MNIDPSPIIFWALDFCPIQLFYYYLFFIGIIIIIIIIWTLCRFQLYKMEKFMYKVLTIIQFLVIQKKRKKNQFSSEMNRLSLASLY